MSTNENLSTLRNSHVVFLALGSTRADAKDLVTAAKAAGLNPRTRSQRGVWIVETA